MIAGSAAYTSEMRGTTVFSFVTIVRRSAFDSTLSSTLIGRRCDTPLRRSTRLSSRASNAIRSINSAMKSGTRTDLAPFRSTHASCWVMAVPNSTVSG